ncbi:hypothetical protein VCRA2110O2_30094 [Vibrio crassostreae]|nr:hypothetical protein VCHA44O286_50283 [Vibrio chagasii]CAK2848386.1 hypothetical protein VCRA2110O2_30094 [Vibrio crassostreae]
MTGNRDLKRKYFDLTLLSLGVTLVSFIATLHATVPILRYFFDVQGVDPRWLALIAIVSACLVMYIGAKQTFKYSALHNQY